MELYNNNVCLTIEELIPAVISMPNYKWHVKKGNIKMARTARGLGHYALIDYDSLPLRFKQRYIEIYGADAHELMAKDTKSHFVLDAKAREFYEAFLLPNGEHIPERRIEEYVINASMMQYVINRISEMRRLRKVSHNVRTPENDVWACFEGEYEAMRADYGHTLPPTIKSLRNKLSAYKKEGYAALIDKKLGNSNTVKITEAGGRCLIALRRSRTPVYSFEEILSEYNSRAADKGWKPLKSVGAVMAYLQRPGVAPLWYGGVFGELQAKQKFGRKMATQLPSRRDSLWYGDGTKLNLYYKEYTKKGWALRTTSVYEVMDAFSEVLLGYHISDSENYEAQYKAFRMAVERAGRKPYEIVTDNQGGHKKLAVQGFFQRICHVYRTTQPHNPQSKTIEQAFGRFQRDVLGKMYGFTGANITAKSGGDVNMEFIQANVEKLPELEELKRLYKDARERWNAAAHPAYEGTRLEEYEHSSNEECEVLTDSLRVSMFYFQTERPSTYTDSGITVTIDGKECRYEVLTQSGMPDLAFYRKNTFAKFFVKYDPYNPTRVKLYKETSTGELAYVADALPYVKIHRAIQDQTAGERQKIDKILKAQAAERVWREMEAAKIEFENGTAPEQNGFARPKMQGISAAEFERIADGLSGVRAAKKDCSIGQTVKDLSNVTIDQLQDGDWVESRAASKL